MTERVKRGDWKHEPASEPVPIPAPDRIWSDDEMDRIRLGLLAESMDDKWFAYMEDNQLYLHRSWTGHGIYEATFTKTDGGHRISSAYVTDDYERYRRSSVETESARLERLISSLLLHEGPDGPWPSDQPQGPNLGLALGDITTEQVDAIVNAANSSLLGGGGVDGAIHRAAGPELAQHCRNLGGCKTGQAKITPAFGLDAQWIIHTVGPVWRGGTSNEPELLASCYRESLARADEVGAEQIAFPAISTGIYGYPTDAAARVAVDTIRSTLANVSSVRFIAFDQETWNTYADIISKPLAT